VLPARSRDRRRLRILHCLRAPVGGLFRHVRDLAAAQHNMGHEVGVVCDSATGDGLTRERLEALRSGLALGLTLVPMSREIGWRDVTACRSAVALARRIGCDVIHGHGAKGGAYSRIAGAILKRGGSRIASFYTPHGGSLHYHPGTLKGRIYMGLERQLAGVTDGIVFESAYSAGVYRDQVGTRATRFEIIPNGLLPEEFGEHRPAAGAADVLFVGELRRLKGVDLLLEALAGTDTLRQASALVVGEGPDRVEFEALAARLGLAARVRFAGAMPAREAFPLGRVLALPSRAESFPYVVLEAGAAGLPLVATAVGGIPEIVAGTDTGLVPPEDSGALARALARALADPAGAAGRAARLRAAIQARFTVARMAAAIDDLYAAAVA
jgi:glycosyltransferase involved in cell wall biosynthesis